MIPTKKVIGIVLDKCQFSAAINSVLGNVINDLHPYIPVIWETLNLTIAIL